MWKKIRLFWSLTAICLGGALVVSWAGPAGAVPYSKKPIYDDTNLSPTPMSVGTHFYLSQNGDIVYQTQIYSGGSWLYALYLYHHGDGSVTQIPSGTWQKSFLQINDQGQVVWMEHDVTSKQDRIFLYQNGVTTPISGSTYGSDQPRLNNQGQVAYRVYSDNEAIYFYDGNASVPITSNPNGVCNPAINDNGQIAWYGGTNDGSNIDVFFFDGSTIRQISNVANLTQALKMQLSQDGWVIWEIGAGGGYVDHYALYLYKGGDPGVNTVQLASNINYLSPDPKFGGNGQVVWIERQAGSGNDYLWQYLNGGTSQVSTIPCNSFDVNRKGQIAYSAGYTIYLYGNNTSTQISPSGNYVAPIINNSGNIVYFSNNSVYNSQDTVYVYNRGITKLDDPHTFGYDRNLQLINNGQIAWFERVTAYITQPDEARIWLAKPVPAANAALDLLLLY